MAAIASPVRLGPEMTIAQAATHRETLLEALSAGEGDLVLDLSDVGDFDSSGVQLLVALRHSLAEQGRGLVLAGAGAPVADALALFGLDALFPAAAPTAAA
jgi:anti-sigma B factor antagonist